ncbi:hypothetical protein G7072_04600 [Nocardioides sp. HDW12B]|uniref:hypothetical protein n=1 Tax=Nocardioides sp. HDW12B TaxID=2714939 RepID=UPI00140860AB|nr:hypothetical protein [Nocardioides sp. HDW12B]QIK65717.1 hypothetical protein G7072_04600 [Nocardioides sp. HDW12B]
MRPARRALTLRTAALTAAGVLALAGLSGCGQDEPATEAAASPTESASETPSETASEAPEETLSASPSATKPTRTPPSATPAPTPTGLVVDVTVRGDEVSPQAEVVEADIDSPITLQIQSDRAGEMHVHASPEQYVEFGPGSTTAQIVIENPGAIDVEEHETGALVLKLLVQ